MATTEMNCLASGGAAGLNNYAFLFAGTGQGASQSTGLTDNSTLYTISTGDESGTATATVNEGGNYHYIAERISRGQYATYSLTIGGNSIPITNPQNAEGDVTLSANDTCVISTSASGYLSAMTVVLYKV